MSRQLSNCTHNIIGTNCKKCGIYIHQNDTAIKTTLFNSVTHLSAKKYLKQMRKRKCQKLQYRRINQSTSQLLQSICQKFQYSLQTLTLGMYVFSKSCQKQQKDQNFWASVSLLVASKGIQLDKKVPYLNRYQRYADKSFTQQDYQQAQRTVFQQMDFNLQFSTFVTFLHFYLTNGIIFKSDNCSFISIKIIQDDILAKAKILVKKGQFIDKDPQILALSTIKEYRLRHRLNPWPKQLQNLSGYKAQNINNFEYCDILQPIKNIQYKIKQRTNYIENIEINKRHIKKNLQIKLHNYKENSIKPVQTNQKFTRNQTFSTNKFGQGSILSRSTDRLMTLQSYISRRV